ncbi:sugar phosphate isomerase/epimerase family protein [Candidatus Oscillochloris fontis]|uniref:sugar phosphate isomerase/epimerase family protein n=1 Tax=Candidatus Oscillochloris fontis TaxID=2496868 RepID=UPI001EE9113E|nr:sugar phosphate isomerase/epimerase [Candidatus Oscillochloris fontis]
MIGEPDKICGTITNILFVTRNLYALLHEERRTVLIGLSALSFSYRCGLVGRGTNRVVSKPFSIDDIITLAVRAGLQSVEFPLEMLPDLGIERLHALRARIAACHLIAVVDSDVADVATLERHIPAAAALGARVLRVTISSVLEGWRSRLITDWGRYLDEVSARLRAVRSLAEKHDVILAIENHQDATADDLLQIIAAVGGQHIGVTFDAVNAFIVAEEPLACLERVSPYVRNIHISDYTVYPSDQGWRLVRCSLGEGDMNLRRLFAAIDQYAPSAPCQIELVNHSARHIRLYADDWWVGYPSRDVRDLLPVLREFARSSRSVGDDWRTPWERGAAEDMNCFYEDQQFASSITYLRTIGMLPRV